MSLILNNLKNNNSVGLDGTSANILKFAAEEITPSLTYLINRAILEHKVPTKWKRAKGVPLFKNGNKELPNNYRPISVLPVVSTILEPIGVLSFGDPLFGPTFWTHFFHIHIVHSDFFPFFPFFSHETASVIGLAI